MIVLIGPSGAGKGAQAHRLTAARQFRHVATGDLFRNHIRRSTEIGRQVRSYIERGELVPEETTEAVVQESLATLQDGRPIVLDGYPRTEYQAAYLEQALAEIGAELDAAIYLSVPDERIIADRIPGRLTCESCERPYHERHDPPRIRSVCDTCGGRLYRRTDDTAPWARARLRVFHRQTAPVVEHYQKAGKLIVIDGEGSMQDVEEKLTSTVEALERREARRATPEESQQIQALRQPPRRLAEAEVGLRSLDVVLLGAPGSGKGTQAEQLRDRLQVPHVSTGELFRKHVKNRTKLGRLARTYIERGELVPDDVTESMVRQRLARRDTRRGFILDGFPRTLPQAEALTDILTELGRRLSGVLCIAVSDEALIRRLSGRWICRRCQTPYHTEFNPPVESGICDRCGGELYQREDDRPETVRARLRTFHRETAPVIEYYRKAGVLFEICGEGEISEVTRQAAQTIERMRPAQG